MHATAAGGRLQQQTRIGAEHGYENEWEETHNEQEKGCPQDHPPRERRTGGSEKNQRQEEGAGAQENCRPQDCGPQGAGETRRREEASQARCAEEESSSEEAGRGAEAGSGPKASSACSASAGVAANGTACDGITYATAACSSYWWRRDAFVTGRQHAWLYAEPERAALSTFLGEGRRRHVGGRGGRPEPALPPHSVWSQVRPMPSSLAFIGS